MKPPAADPSEEDGVVDLELDDAVQRLLLLGQQKVQLDVQELINLKF